MLQATFARPRTAHWALLVALIGCVMGVNGAHLNHLRRIQSKTGGVVVSDSIQNGDAVPTSATTVIAGENDMDAEGAITFGDDLHSDDNRRQTLIAAPLSASDPATTMHQSSRASADSSEVHWGDPDSFRQHAIRRVAQGIPDLLKKVDAAKALYNRRAFSDYYDALPHHNGDATALLEVGSQMEMHDMEQFLALSDQERVSVLQSKRDHLTKLRDSIQLELAATARMQDKVKSSTEDAVVHHRAAPRLDEELKASDALAELNPQLKEWADESHFHQNKREINSLLEETSKFLDSFQSRLRHDYVL